MSIATENCVWYSMEKEVMDMLNCIAVGMGGFLGAVCRYLIGLIPIREVTLFPLKTFGINLVGCFLIAAIIAAVSKGIGIPPRWELFLKAGFCGGFTTFSTFAAETAALMQQGHAGIAVLYAVLSVLVGVTAVLLMQGT